MNTRTPKMAATVPGEDRPEPGAHTRAMKMSMNVNMNPLHVSVWVTHVKADFGAGGGQTDVIGHGNINAVDPRVVEEVAEHQLALFGRLHHVAHRVKGPQALCIQDHTAHLLWKAGREEMPRWGRPVGRLSGPTGPELVPSRPHLPWQVTVISRTFPSLWGDDPTALSICMISTFSMASGTAIEGGGAAHGGYPSSETDTSPK